MRKSAHRHPVLGAPLARRWTVLAALFAVLLQAFVVQTHVHRAETPAPLAVSVGLGVGAGDARREAVAATVSAGKADCILCQALAGSGRATLAVAAALPEIRALAPLAPLVLVVAAPKRATLPWRSRAPPIAL
ncbi:MAG TPA: hypothetical protein VG841_05930 [Caulobacterales bacterium]|nr:hypothetical protein [Caulobacterales bacterium]